MKKYSKLVVFILLFYSCKEKIIKHSTLDYTPILDYIDSARNSHISVPTVPPPTDEAFIDIETQILLNVPPPKTVGRNHDEVHPPYFVNFAAREQIRKFPDLFWRITFILSNHATTPGAHQGILRTNPHGLFEVIFS